MATLTAMQVAAAAYLGGFRGDRIAEAVAVARGESSFQTDKCTGQYCGLFQIGTTVNKAHLHGDWKDPAVNARAAKELVDSRGWCGGKASNGHCQNFEAYGLDNAGATWAQKLAEGKQAKKDLDKKVGDIQLKSRLSVGGQVFGPPSYAEAARRILKEAGVDTTQGGSPGVQEAVGNAAQDAGLGFFSFPQLEGFFKALTQRATWVRVAEVVIGVGLVFVGLSQFSAVKKIAGTAMQVVPAGKVAKLASAAGAAKGA